MAYEASHRGELIILQFTNFPKKIQPLSFHFCLGGLGATQKSVVKLDHFPNENKKLFESTT